MCWEVWHIEVMTFRSDASYDSDRARSGGGRGRGAALGVGGGIGGILLVGLLVLLGGDPSQLGALLGGETGSGEQLPAGEADALAHCRTIEDANQYADCRIEATASSVDRVWEGVLPEQAGLAYAAPGIEIFQGQTVTGCGAASAATGPFYCPADQSAYLDVSFFGQMEQFGAENAPLAQMYIVAHEFGHHIQQLEGTLGLSNYNDPGPTSAAVALELQADCYAGIWAHHADEGEDAMLEPITREQLASAIETARAVGDDNIQERSGGEVNPDQWTHGSSQQRQDAFMAGYVSGQMNSCDTLGRGVYRG